MFKLDFPHDYLNNKLQFLLKSSDSSEARAIIIHSHFARTNIQNFLGEVVGPSLAFVDFSNYQNDNSPFFPLSSYLREVESLEIKDSDERIYSLHQPLWKKLIKCTREKYEPLILDESIYERQKILEGAATLLEESLPQGPGIIFLGSLHKLSCAFLDFLETYLKENTKSSYFFVLESHKSSIDDAPCLQREKLEFFLHNTEDFFRHVSLESSSAKVTDEPHLASPPALVPEDNLIECINFLMRFTCFTDAMVLCEQSWGEDKEFLDTEHRVYYHSLAARYHMFLGDHDQALSRALQALNSISLNNKKPMVAEVYLLLAQLYYLKDNSRNSHSYSSMALNILSSGEYSEIEVKALFLKILIDSRENYLPQKEWDQCFQRFIGLCEILGYDNMLSYWLARPDRMDPVLEATEVDRFQKRGLEIAEKLGNLLRLSAALHTRGFTFVVRGEYHRVIELYKKSESLRLELNTPLELAYLQNGLGYFLHQRGEYKAAEESLSRAFGNAMKARDFHEVGMVLCNMGINYLYSFCWDEAREYFDQTKRLLDTLGIPGLSYHSEFEILTLYAISLIMSGSKNRALHLFRRLQTDKEIARAGDSRLQSELEEKLAYMVLMALVARDEGQIELCQAHIIGGMDHVKSHSKIIGYRKKFVQAFKKSPLKTKPLFQPSHSGVIDFVNLSYSLKAELALHKSVRAYEEISFLQNLQNVLESSTLENVISNCMGLISVRFTVNTLCLGQVFTGGRSNLCYAHDSKNRIDEKTMEILAREAHKKAITPLLDHSDPNWRPEMEGSKWLVLTHATELKWSVFLALGFPIRDQEPDQETLRLFTMVITAIAGALVRLNQKGALISANKQLKELASVDALTRVNNRMALNKRLQEESKRMNRKNRKTAESFSVLFMDLDNFKLYNDHFGHEVGDRILVHFSELLASITRESDFIARYGGDEFILILPETNIQGAQVVAQKILDTIRSRDSFHPEIESRTGITPRMNLGERLGCSIGGCEYDGRRILSTDELLRLADKALYESKNKGKGVFTPFVLEETV